MYIHPFVCGIAATIITEIALLIVFVITHGNKVNKDGRN